MPLLVGQVDRLNRVERVVHQERLTPSFLVHQSSRLAVWAIPFKLVNRTLHILFIIIKGSLFGFFIKVFRCYYHIDRCQLLDQLLNLGTALVHFHPVVQLRHGDLHLCEDHI